MHAEADYLFRHALAHGAAYALCGDAERSRLHGLAFEVLGSAAGGNRLILLSLARHALAAGAQIAPDRSAAALFAAAQAAEGMASFDDAIGFYESVLGVNGAPLAVCIDAGKNAGRLCYATGKAARARTHYEAALNAARASGEFGKCSEVLNALGVLLHEQGEIENAQASLEEAIGLARKAGHVQSEILSAGNLASVFRDVGRMAEAKIMCARNIELCRDNKMRVAQAMGVFNMAAFLHTNGELGAAKGYYDEALKLMREVGNLRNEAIALSNMSTFQRSLGDLVAAEAVCRNALDVCRRAGHRRFEAINCSNLAGMLHDRGLDAEALSLHREAIRIQREIGDTRHQGLSTGNLAAFFSDVGELGRALAAYAEALALLEQNGAQDLAGAFRGLRGQFRLMLGDRIGAAEDLQNALWGLEGAGAAAMRAECVLLLKLRLAADRTIEEKDSAALDEARNTLAEMKGVAQKGGYGSQSGLGRAVRAGEALLAELEAAQREGRTPNVHAGHLPQEISLPAQAALQERLLARGGKPSPVLGAAGPAPDWRASDYE